MQAIHHSYWCLVEFPLHEAKCTRHTHTLQFPPWTCKVVSDLLVSLTDLIHWECLASISYSNMSLSPGQTHHPCDPLRKSKRTCCLAGLGHFPRSSWTANPRVWAECYLYQLRYTQVVGTCTSSSRYMVSVMLNGAAAGGGDLLWSHDSPSMNLYKGESSKLLSKRIKTFI